MPAPIDDNTFFIIYALSKQNKIDVSCLSHLYPNKNIKQILDTFNILIDELHIKIHFYDNKNSNEDAKVLQIIKDNNKHLSGLAEVLNTEIKYNVDFGLDIFEAVENKVAPIILGCKFEHSDKKFVQNWIKNYFEKSENFRKKLFHHEEVHEKVFRKVLKMAKNNMSAPYNITLKDFEFFSTKVDLPQHRYAFFHYLYEQEKLGKISA